MEQREARDDPDNERSRAADRRRGPERLEAFSDGVLAIAITLLVLEIRVPPGEDLAEPSRLLAALGALWPSYLGYVISFVTIGIIWTNHHNLFRIVDRVSHGLILANLLLLLTIGFLPFPTALLAATLPTPSAQVGVLVYAGALVVVSIAFNAVWHEIRTRPGVLGGRCRGPVSCRDLAELSARSTGLLRGIRGRADQPDARDGRDRRPDGPVPAAVVVGGLASRFVSASCRAAAIGGWC
jgi:uncharacterized membrane protein